MNSTTLDRHTATEALLNIEELCVSFGSRSYDVRVVDRVNLSIPNGKTVALVGESGCGKSVTALSILGLLPSPPGRVESGRILFADPVARPSDPVDLLKISGEPLRRIRGNRIAMVFQEPMTSLNPVLTVGEQIVEVLDVHRGLKGKKAWLEATELLRQVGIADPRRRVRNYPHQMSGGMRQRVMISIALACQPALLIADEPTTALDVTVQRQILDLLTSLQQETDLSVLLITHDLGVVAGHADHVYVMYAGRIVEQAPVAELFENPLHPYTKGLLQCSPSATEQLDRLHVIPGQVPDPSSMPSGCRFHPRCVLTQERAEDATKETVRMIDSEKNALRRCVETCESKPSGAPELTQVSPDHSVACWEV